MPETLPWKDPACPIKVEYDPAAFEGVRRLAVDGLLSLPRVGLGVGGFLLGTRQADAVLIVDFVPIPCSHTTGPSFAPTPGEIEQGRASATEKTAASLEILGYYCSRPRLPVQIAEKDQLLYRALCPGAGQFALLIRPSATDVTFAGLFYRIPNGYLAGGTELPLEAVEVEYRESASEEPPPGPPPPASAQLFGEPDPIPFPGIAAVEPRNISWPAIAAAVLVVAILILMFTTRERWIPRPPLELRTAETNGQFSIEWNRDAVRGLDHAVLTVVDGTATKPIQLDGRQLEAGTIPYDRQSAKFTARLDAGSIHASATFSRPPDSAEPSHP